MASKVKLKLPASIWTEKDTKVLASNTLATIKRRTSKGLSSNGGKFKDYSTKSMYVSFKGARLKPKGGRLSRTGNSVFYAGGYEQYKHDSRKRSRTATKGQSAEVDLVLSGQLMNNLVVLEASLTRFRIGLTKHVQHYGYAVHEKRPYIGLTDNEINILVNAVSYDISEKLRKGK
jgi:hypothetical protein